MRILVLSDTHGDFRRLWEIVERHKDDTRLVLFLGDGLREFDDVQTLYPDLIFDCVAGNCDYGKMEKRTALIAVSYTHLKVGASVPAGLRDIVRINADQTDMACLYFSIICFCLCKNFQLHPV